MQKLVANEQNAAVRETQGVPKNRQPHFLVHRVILELFRDERPEGFVHLAFDTKNCEVGVITDERQQVRLARVPR